MDLLMQEAADRKLETSLFLFLGGGLGANAPSGTANLPICHGGYISLHVGKINAGMVGTILVCGEIENEVAGTSQVFVTINPLSSLL